VGSRESEVELSEGTRLGELSLLLRAEYGDRVYHLLGGEEIFSRVTVLVNGRHPSGLEGLETALAENDTVVILPPAAGG
jgi:molybdopterin converting factor small subunit